MLAVLRILIVTIYSILVCFFGCIYCLFSPRDPRHASTFSHLFGQLAPVFGLKVYIRKPEGYQHYPNAIYICNHQNNFDLITVSNIVQPSTVTVGKISILWIPLFGFLYWLSGNLLIDRNNFIKAHKTIMKLIVQFQKKRISFWFFPEGTRSYGRGLLPFKMGAFYAAIVSGVPIIPIVASNTHRKIKLNKFNNGIVIVEMLQPIYTNIYTHHSARQLALHCRELMLLKMKELNAEVTMYEKTCITRR
ncbi:1-acylglycerol-3-phosphate O-acyltransferase [Candidatus Erwinia haradaeae]|uniref:1-acyl-sn-glycerol-3-phosphate acyltransferase n=1 Tax=Candidatus Erwinia haradaeae TaxID=1922217 RepID=A0A451D2V9_9GAMM|nr:1-acylglycerol-3-phosphate O-acyltransferase [Candidatus Erwinia haradaeae]VFP80009.1 1-acyl-sn-glycerol-3-phosphate acyltransferase [Candidatus Erwinia haradaeae]